MASAPGPLGGDTSTELLSLRWLLGHSVLELIPIVVGEASFAEVQPTELTDPGEFLRPHALVLTVGLAFVDNPAGYTDYVARLERAQVAAIGFGTGLVFAEVPQPLVAAATAAGIPVFEVPRHIPFLSVSSVVHGEYSRRAQRELTRQAEYQEELNQAAVTGDLAEILATLRRLLGVAAAVCDDHGTALAYVELPGLDAREVAKRAAQQDQLVTSAFSGAGHYHLIQKTARRTPLKRFLVVSSASPLSPLARRTLRYVVGLIDIVLRMPVQVRDHHTGLNTMALEILLGHGRDEAFLAKVLSHAIDDQGRVKPVVLSSDRPKALGRLTQDLDLSLSDLGRAFYHVAIDPATVLVLFHGQRSTQEIGSLLGPRLQGVRVAVGRAIAWQDINLTLVDALRAEALAAPPGVMATAGTTGLGWLHTPEVKQALDKRAAETLHRLHAYDAAEGTELAGTLAAYLRSGNTLAEAAHTLGIHRHTMRTRLKKIEEICQVDLASPVVCAELLLMVITRDAARGTGLQ